MVVPDVVASVTSVHRTVPRLRPDAIRAYAPAVPTSAVTAATSAERECLRAAGLVALGVAAAAVLLWASTFPGWPLAAGVILSVFVLAGLLMTWGAEPRPAARWLRPAGLVL